MFNAMKCLSSIILLALTLLACQKEKSPDNNVKNESRTVAPVSERLNLPDTAKVNMLHWLRMDLAAFGCLLENEFSYRHPQYNCSLRNYKNDGDPCKNTQAYYEGLTFPDDKRIEIHSLIDTIMLDFEHGELRQIDLQFTSSLTEKEVRHIFSIDSADLPQNVVAIDYHEADSGRINGLMLVGFEHIGAGDVDCSEMQ
jgi:hypothetical protein